MSECAHCGAEVDDLDVVEQDGLTFCSEECVKEYEDDEDLDEEDDDEEGLEDEPVEEGVEE